MTMAAAIEGRTADARTWSKASRIASVDIVRNLASTEMTWRGLEQQFCTPYQRFDFLRAWQREVGEREGLAPFIVMPFDANRRPLLVLPLALRQAYGARCVHFMGGKHSTFNMALWDRDFAASTTTADLDALLVENAEMRDRLLRTLADMENLRRRTEREKADTARYAITNFARVELTDPALKTFLEGVELTERELLNVLERHGVTRIEPLGQRFDPNFQQAMFEVQNPDVAEGTVVDVMQAGYAIGDRCLWPALVAIVKGGSKQVKAQGDGDAATRKAANDDFPDGGWPGD